MKRPGANTCGSSVYGVVVVNVCKSLLPYHLTDIVGYCRDLMLVDRTMIARVLMMGTSVCSSIILLNLQLQRYTSPEVRAFR